MTLSDPHQLATVLEGLLLAAGKPMSLERLFELFEEHERPDSGVFREALGILARSCEGRAFELKEVASGYRLQVRERFAPWVGRLWEERPQRYSRALLETLALIAYRQPITRGEIEDVRGVAVNSNITKTLLEREWIRVVGYRDVPGRPAMFATTKGFLDHFNLRSLDELPPLAALRSWSLSRNWRWMTRRKCRKGCRRAPIWRCRRRARPPSRGRKPVSAACWPNSTPWSWGSRPISTTCPSRSPSPNPRRWKRPSPSHGQRRTTEVRRPLYQPAKALMNQVIAGSATISISTAPHSGTMMNAL